MKFRSKRARHCWRGGTPGIKRHLVDIRLEDSGVFLLSDELNLRNEEVIGHVTSAISGYTPATAVVMGDVACEGIALKDLATVGRYAIELAAELHADDASIALSRNPPS